MQKVCDVLEQLLAEGVIQKYAIGGGNCRWLSEAWSVWANGLVSFRN